MKKLYIAPNLRCVHVESLGLICKSNETPTPQPNLEGWLIDNTLNGNDVGGTPTEDVDAPIYSKHYDAWTTWDE